MKTEMGEIPAESSVGDYRTVDGVLTPFLVKQKVLGQEFTVTLQSMKTNVEIPKERFALPDDVKALAAGKETRDTRFVGPPPQIQLQSNCTLPALRDEAST